MNLSDWDLTIASFSWSDTEFQLWIRYYNLATLGYLTGSIEEL